MNRGRAQGRSIAFLAVALGLSCGASLGEPRVPPDQSLTPHQYQQLGFPPLASDWTADDRARARTVLRSLAGERPEELPRLSSKSSGAVFEKLIREEFHRRGDLESEVASVPASELERMESEELAQRIQSDSLEGIYAPESTGGLLFDRELVEFTFQRLGQALALRSDLRASLAGLKASPTAEQDFAARDRELLQASDQLIVQLLSNLTAAAVAERFSPAAKSDAVSHLGELVPHVAPLLSPEAQANLRETIGRAAASPGADPRIAALSRQW